MSRFIKNVMKLGSATAIAQLLGVLTMPVVTRLYTPADFGLGQIFISIVLIMGSVSCFSYYLAIMLPETDREAANVFVLCIILIAAVSIVSGAIFWLLSDWLEGALNVPGFSCYLILLPGAIFFYSLTIVVSLWLSRGVRFGTIAASRMTGSIFYRLFQVGFGLLSASPLGLIAGSMVNDIVSNAIMIKEIAKDQKLLRSYSLGEMRALAIRYREFPIFSTGSMLAEAGYFNLSSFMLAFFFNPIVVGYYALAFTVVKLPLKLVGNAIYSVFYQKGSEERKLTGGCHNVVKQVNRRLISIGMFPFLILIVIGEDLFILVFGADWATAGLYVKILAPWIFILFISEPMISIFNIMERMAMNFSFNVLILASGIAALYIGGVYGDPLPALLLFSSTGTISYGFRYFYLLHLAGASINGSILDIIHFLVIGCIIVTPLIIGNYLFLGPVTLFVLATAVSLVYYLIIIIEDVKLRNECLLIIKAVHS
jgi:lipopolysaccharide exporter